MKLHNKIYYYRKKTGRTQESLAEELGVSRQAVSKWETGESEPELSNIKLLAVAFGITVDELLSEASPQEEKAEERAENRKEPTPEERSNWVDSIPGVLGKLFRRYGWLGGVYMAVVGVITMLMGGVVFLMMNAMSDFHQESLEDIGGMMMGTFESASPSMFTPFHNIMSIMGWLFVAIGGIVTVCGVFLAVYLRRRGRK